jgi:glycosyltransferase involved in cell wall biosynthesis
MRLALVIPALNEEQAIGDTLRRTLASREKVLAETPVTEMTIVFVNDGSTDGTQSIVDQPEFDEVVKVRFEKNRGYGAAIKAGWQATDADLVGFMDADGTCDPDFCVKLLNRMFEAEADVILAGRLNPESEMPLIRKIGNILFARLLGLVSGKDLTDSASGFRIVKRSSLKLMSPLPDGLHFTPAMSCICLLDPRLHIEEVPMPYKERIGRSKLSVVKDGLRFLYIILFSACCYAPIKTLTGASVLVAAGWSALVWLTLAAGASHGIVAVLAFTGMVLILLLFGSAVVVHQLNFLLIGPRRHIGWAERILQYLLEYRRLMLIGAVTTTVGTLGLAGYSVMSSDTDAQGLINAMKWAGLILLGGSLLIGSVIVRVVWAVGEKQKALIHDEYAGAATGTTARGNESMPAQEASGTTPQGA